MIPDTDSTQSMQRPLWQHPRAHLLDDVWLLTILAILIAIGIPGLSGDLQVHIAAASWGLLGLGGLHLLFTALAHPTGSPGRWRSYALTLLDAIGVALIALIWMNAGGIENPLFLAIFVMPVVGSIFLSRWHPFLIAALCIVFVVGVAFYDSPELRSYASELLGGNVRLQDLFGQRGPGPQGSFAGFYAPTSYLVVLLEVFAISLFACALAARYLGVIFERLMADASLARSEGVQAKELWAALIERMPVPALLVDPHSLRVVACSDAALLYLDQAGGSLNGQELFSVARFSFADLIQDMIAGTQSEPSLIAIHVADELRFTQVKVLQVQHRKRRLALLTLEDVTQSFCLKAALDSAEYAALVVDARGYIRAFNKPSGELFNGIAPGTSAEKFLSHPVAGLPWWEPGLTGRRKMHIEIGARIYEVTSSDIPVPGEEQRLYSVSLLPVARATPRGAARDAPALPSKPRTAS